MAGTGEADRRCAVHLDSYGSGFTGHQEISASESPSWKSLCRKHINEPEFAATINSFNSPQ